MPSILGEKSVYPVVFDLVGSWEWRKLILVCGTWSRKCEVAS